MACVGLLRRLESGAIDRYLAGCPHSVVQVAALHPSFRPGKGSLHLHHAITKLIAALGPRTLGRLCRVGVRLQPSLVLFGGKARTLRLSELGFVNLLVAKSRPAKGRGNHRGSTRTQRGFLLEDRVAD